MLCYSKFNDRFKGVKNTGANMKKALYTQVAIILISIFLTSCTAEVHNQISAPPNPTASEVTTLPPSEMPKPSHTHTIEPSKNPTPTFMVTSEPTLTPSPTIPAEPTPSPTPDPTPSPSPIPTPVPTLNVYPSQEDTPMDEDALTVINEAFIKLPHARGYGVIPHELNSEIVLTVKYSDGYTEFDNIQNHGPDSFDIHDGKIYICNSYGDSILVYENGILLDIIELESVYFAKDINVKDDCIDILERDHNQAVRLITIDMDGNILYDRSVTSDIFEDVTGYNKDKYFPPYKIKGYTDETHVIFRSGYSCYWENDEYQASDLFKLNSTLEDNKTVTLTDFNLRITTVGNKGWTDIIDVIDDYRFIIIQETYSEDILIRESNLYVIKEGNVTKKIRLLSSPYITTSPSSSIRVDESGDIYQMMYDDNYDLYIYKLNMDLAYASLIKVYLETGSSLYMK